ncbi:hypothetical protein CSX00_02460 [Pseudobutyrivibrio ruminis]|uniref:Uncharacterized protein n=1 Tax=Pseudobutyrivibrio ruminis TaxID=46206 RepID=A0A2G3EDH2_9FIRM|nr:hypothetical protein [Pseudobutyrivibrio ruminis]PHU41195.1 hypothetical protein CSX00_02460 [Pseudobutyrivibrio ruminis]
MQIDYVSVFEKLKERDILFNGRNNLAVKKEIEPFINLRNLNERMAYKYLLVQYEFYIFHSLYCVDLIEAGVCESDMLQIGFTSFEIDTARQLLKRYGRAFEKKKYLYLANIKMGLIASAICLILENKPLDSVPIEILASARRRIKYANDEYKKELMIRSS